MVHFQIVLACLAISSATAEPQLEHPALAYAAGAHHHLLGGAYSPDLYGVARSLSPLQYASSLPVAYAAQLLNQDPFHRTRTFESAPLHYSGQSYPVSYAAGPQAYGGGGAGGVPAYPSLPHHHHAAVEYPPPYATASSYHQAGSAIHHTPQYASYAATPVQHAAPLPPSVLGGYTSAATGHPHHPSAVVAAPGGAPSFLSSAAGGHPLAAYAAATGAFQHHPGSPSAAATYLQALDAAGGMGPGAGGRHPAEQFYAGARGGPLSYSGQMAQGAASAEATHRMAAQLSALIAAQGSMGEARAQARSDSE